MHELVLTQRVAQLLSELLVTEKRIADSLEQLTYRLGMLPRDQEDVWREEGR